MLTDIHDNWTYLEEMISLASKLDGVVFLGDLLIHGSFEKHNPVAFTNFSRIHGAAKFTVGVPGNSATRDMIKFLNKNDFNVHGKSRILNGVGFFGVGGSPDPVNLILELRDFFQRETRPAIELQDKALETLAVFGVKIKDDVFVVDDWTERELKELKQYRGPFDHTEAEIYNILLQGSQSLSNCSIRVLLSHIPPYEPVLNTKFPEGISTGSIGITKFIKEFRPSAVLSGHYHIFHEFDIDSIPCLIFPAATDGFYSILHINQHMKKFTVKVKTF